MNIIEIKDLCKSYKEKQALNNVSFTVSDNSLFGLLGVNGAGKTTLIKILTGLIKKTSGSVKIFGYDLDTDILEIKKIVNVSPQEVSVAKSLTVRENLEFFCDIYGMDKTHKVNEIIDEFKLNEVQNDLAKTLSGGWMRRLSIAIALISEPKILFLDEPTLGLDVIARKELWREIEKIKRKTTIILTSHYLEEIEALCDKVAILSKGVLLDVGTVEEIIKKTNTTKFEDAFIKVVEGSN